MSFGTEPLRTDPDAMESIRDQAETIRTNLPSVLAHLQALVQREPALALLDHYDISHLPELLRLLIEAALIWPDDSQAWHNLLLAAAHHGERRQGAGWPESWIVAEQRLLRRALWSYLETSSDSLRTFEVMARLDVALMRITSAALMGYHRTDVEPASELDELVERLATGCSHPHWAAPQARAADRRASAHGAVRDE